MPPGRHAKKPDFNNQAFCVSINPCRPAKAVLTGSAANHPGVLPERRCHHIL
ncbi:hypothetical protein CHCC15332_3499 [Bacillus paralicheniformis]|nr:hypothetical protein CHCC15332_3499 [Bacillus paralicheniformis]